MCQQKMRVAKSLERKGLEYFEWRFVLRRSGLGFLAIGYPKFSVKPDGKFVIAKGPFRLQELRVTDVFYERRDSVMFPFPCFEVDDEVDQGLAEAPYSTKGSSVG